MFQNPSTEDYDMDPDLLLARYSTHSTPQLAHKIKNLMNGISLIAIEMIQVADTKVMTFKIVGLYC